MSDVESTLEWQEGYNAFINDIGVHMNPYDRVNYTQWRLWNWGWFASETDYKEGK